jgi:hypothetical protein
MSAPNRQDVVVAVHQEHPELLRTNTKPSCTRFRQLVAARLHAEDPEWGELTKQPGQNQSEDGRAVDAIIYRPTMQVVDIISGSGTGQPTKPTWIEQVRRQGNDWAVPTLADAVQPGPVPAVASPPPATDPAVVALSQSILSEVRQLQALVTAVQHDVQTLRADVAAVNAAVHGERGVGGTIRLMGVSGTFSGKAGGPG